MVPGAFLYKRTGPSIFQTVAFMILACCNIVLHVDNWSLGSQNPEGPWISHNGSRIIKIFSKYFCLGFVRKFYSYEILAIVHVG